jgi:excisionase family DNA binding protein
MGKKADDGKPRFEPLVVTVRDAMNLLGDSRSTIYRKIRQGRLKSHLYGARRKISFASVKALAEQPSA